MGEIVNRTAEVAAAWQRQVVWIRMNVGYIKAELAYLAARKHEVSDIEALVGAFGPTFTRFCEEELEAFVLARRAEDDPASRAALAAQLRCLREGFRPWIQQYHELVEKTTEVAPGSLRLSLLLGCGAEVHSAYGSFISIIDEYIRDARLRE